jgi:hypothetical protein
MDEISISGPLKCRDCGAAVDRIMASKFEGCCRECFMKKINKRVHPF